MKFRAQGPRPGAFNPLLSYNQAAARGANPCDVLALLPFTPRIMLYVIMAKIDMVRCSPKETSEIPRTVCEEHPTKIRPSRGPSLH